ncbi:MAG: DNA polymerase I [Oscillospiraceae bacterium]|nr:DNA polymerase I [Oscillospiraceae bacterium]
MKLLLIDGNSIMNRAYYGIRLLTNKKGVPTNALTGFLNIYCKLMKEERPDRIAAAFDLKAPTFRHKMYAEYKGTRHGMPDELAAQMPLIKDILRSLGIAVLEVEGYEADDIIGTLSRAAAEQGTECVISTGDRDSFQLVNDRVTVRLASNKEDIYYTPEKINEVYGVTPREMLEVKALMGDSSDNIPGVKGIGEKTALSLIQKYHSVQYIFDNLAEIDVAKGTRTKLEGGRESAELSRQLGEICLTAPVSENMEDYAFGEGDKSAAVGILQELEMNTAIKKLDLAGVTAKEVRLSVPETIAEKTSAKPSVTADTAEYDGDALDVLLMDGGIAVFQDGKRLDGDLKALLESEQPKHTDNAKAAYANCINAGIDLKNVTFDATLAAYLLNVNATSYDIECLCCEYKIELGTGGVQEAIGALNRALFAEVCAQGMLKVLQEIEIPLAEVLSSMEYEGIALDVDALHRFGEELQPRIVEIEQLIHDLAGRKFNVGSPKQLSVVLFEELGLPAGKKRKTGYSTDSETLEFLIDKHPIIKPILEYRKLTKLYNTYVKGLENAVSENGRMYTTFKQTETRTGRISSAEPNIQNIPVRTEIGRNFRKFFTAAPGNVLCDADYSQIELRVLAALAGDKVMIETFREGRDIHAETAASVFRRGSAEVDSDLRRKAKAVNFGIVYGIGAFSLAKDINTSVYEAKQYIEDYLAHFAGVKQYMDTNTQSAEVDGYAVTMFGRRRFIPEILSTNKTVKALGKRIAMNTPIQGTAADIIKIAMVRVYKRLKHELPEAKLILQVHDELIVEAPEAVSQKALQILREEMQSAVELAVPLPVDAKIGKTWFDVH